MKCPACGKWNRASFPTCQYCGEVLEQTGEAPSWRKTLKDDQRGKQYIRVDEEGQAEATPDARDVLAREMNELKLRKAAGREAQRKLRAEGARRGAAPSSMQVRTRATAEDFMQPADEPQHSTARVHMVGKRNDGSLPFEPRRSVTILTPQQEEEEPLAFDPVFNHEFTGTHANPNFLSNELTARIPSRRRGMRHLIRALTILLIVCLAGLTGFFGYEYFKDRKATIAEQNQPIITASMKNDLAAHTIMIPGEDGTQIYISELRTSYIVTGGFATIEIEDHFWYDTNPDFLTETMDVTLTPFVKSSAGKQKPLNPVTYTITIPESPIELVSPDALRTEVSTAMYSMSFVVRPGSTVTINGQDYSDTVSSEDGTLTFNATVQPVGDNVFTVVCRSQYCRETTLSVVLYRAPQEIPLDLAADTYSSTSSKTMLVQATTLPGANVEVTSPHSDLDITNIDSTGAFSFYAIFDHIGYNTISIESSMPGKKTSVVDYQVYYLPSASEYTPKAWPMGGATGSAEYSEYLSNSQTRIKNTQVYVVTGTVQYIVSEKPQMVVINTSADGQSQPVLVENYTKTKWKVGEYYRIYGDAYGLYNNMPWLAARYTYRN